MGRINRPFAGDSTGEPVFNTEPDAAGEDRATSSEDTREMRFFRKEMIHNYYRWRREIQEILVESSP